MVLIFLPEDGKPYANHADDRDTERHGLVLCNDTPIDLNFLLYIHNVYLNLNGEPVRFPGRYSGDTHGFWPYERFADIMRTSWERMLSAHDRDFRPDAGPFQVDHYAAWFTDDAHGRRTLQELWDAFNLWWWPDYGIRQCMDRISDACVPVLWDKLNHRFRNAGYPVPAERVTLLVVFDRPPAPLRRQGRRVYVAGLGELCSPDLIPLAESMFRSLTRGP